MNEEAELFKRKSRVEHRLSDSTPVLGLLSTKIYSFFIYDYKMEINLKELNLKGGHVLGLFSDVDLLFKLNKI